MARIWCFCPFVARPVRAGRAANDEIYDRNLPQRSPHLYFTTPLLFRPTTTSTTHDEQRTGVMTAWIGTGGSHRVRSPYASFWTDEDLHNTQRSFARERKRKRRQSRAAGGPADRQ
jgi:hypothetical protein